MNWQPREYLLLWASGKDRQDPQLPLHTNFKIAVEGEFVGLVAPDGQTVVSSFDAAAQVADVSQGLAPQTTTDWLIDSGSLSDVLIPGDASLAGSWTSRSFVPGPEWTQVSGNGIGFDLDDEYNTWIQHDLQPEMYNINATAYTRYPFSLSSRYYDSIQLHARYEDGLVVYLNGNQVLSRNAPAVPTWNSAATQSRPDSIAISPETFDLSLVGSLCERWRQCTGHPWHECVVRRQRFSDRPEIGRHAGDVWCESSSLPCHHRAAPITWEAARRRC